MRRLFSFFSILVGGVLGAGKALAEYQPLVSSGFLDGPKADVQTAGTSFLAIVAAVAAVGLLIRVLRGG